MARTARFTETLPPMKVTPEQHALVVEEADSQGISLAEVVRAALDTHFDSAREDAVASAGEG